MNNFTHFRTKNIPVISTVFKTFSCHELTFTIVPKPPDIIAEEIPEVKQDLKGTSGGYQKGCQSRSQRGIQRDIYVGFQKGF